MADANSPEYSNNPENSSEISRHIISEIAQKQLIALGYGDKLKGMEKWVQEEDGKPWMAGQTYSHTGEYTGLYIVPAGAKLERLLEEMKRIPDKEQARALAAAALFGIPLAENESGKGKEIVIASFKIEEPSEVTELTKLDPNNAANNVWEANPNTRKTRILAGKVAGTGFLPNGEVQMRAIKQLGWKNGFFEGTYIDDPDTKMRIDPEGNGFKVQIKK